jgi:hypothetical protein
VSLSYCSYWIQYAGNGLGMTIMRFTRIIFFPMAQQPLVGQGLIFEASRSHSRHTTSGRTVLNEWSARHKDLYLTNTPHSQNIDTHAPGGIRTCNASKRAATDPRLRLRGHWDRLQGSLRNYVLLYVQLNSSTRFTRSTLSRSMVDTNFKTMLCKVPYFNVRVTENGNKPHCFLGQIYRFSSVWP